VAEIRLPSFADADPEPGAVAVAPGLALSVTAAGCVPMSHCGSQSVTSHTPNIVPARPVAR
jgi:hypothetical protein